MNLWFIAVIVSSKLPVFIHHTVYVHTCTHTFWYGRYVDFYIWSVFVGTLLRKLENGLRGVSHVIVDEIHERDINVRCCCGLLRRVFYFHFYEILVDSTLATRRIGNQKFCRLHSASSAHNVAMDTCCKIFAQIWYWYEWHCSPINASIWHKHFISRISQRRRCRLLLIVEHWSSS